MAQTRNNTPEGFDGDELPSLSPDDLDDDEVLADVVDDLIFHLDHHDGELVALREELLLQQGVLREVVCDTAWAQFLSVEQVTTARFAALALKLVKLAFEAGRAGQNARDR